MSNCKCIKHKRVTIYLSLVVSLAAMLVMVVPRTAKAAPDSDLYFDPSSESTSVGSDFSLDAVINPGTNAVSAVTLHITFDQTKLRLDSITPSATFALVLAPAVINNTNGTASIDLAVPTSNPSITTTTTIAAFTFHALSGATDSPVEFTSASQAAADSEPGDVITTRTGATVTVTDSVDPVRSNGAPSGSLSSSTNSVTLSLTTDENATCKYGVVQGTTYDSIADTFGATGGTSHSQVITGLSKGNEYNYYVRCKDSLNNANDDDYVISFNVKSSSDSKKDEPKRLVSNKPKIVKRGQIITEKGRRFSKNSVVRVYFQISPGGFFYPPSKITTKSSGKFVINYKIPYYKIKGIYKWYAFDVHTGKKSKLGRYVVE